MDLVIKGRNGRIPDSLRRTAEHKLAKLGRIDPRVVRVEVEVLEERNPRVNGHQRVKVACHTPRRSFRATGSGEDVGAALDQVVDRLDRQLTGYRGKFRARLLAGANRLKFGGSGRPGEAELSE
jgi:ribosomal subunit interface protein